MHAHQETQTLLLRTMHKQALLNRLKLLLARLASTATKNQLGAQLPLKRDLPVLLRLAIDDRVVVLQGGAEAGGLERGPQGELMHGGGVLAPDGEVGGVEGEGLLQGLDGLRVLEEESLITDVSLESRGSVKDDVESRSRCWNVWVERLVGLCGRHRATSASRLLG